jgi:hypothetical protein
MQKTFQARIFSAKERKSGEFMSLFQANSHKSWRSLE